MAEPECAAKQPVQADLKAGKYWWCACGRSNKQPFCDGSHKGSEFQPLEFTLAEDRQAYFCQCKRTANAPFCDGTHNNL